MTAELSQTKEAMLTQTNEVELTLDPPDEKSWEEFRALGHRMLDDMIDHLRALRDQPVWQSVPDDVKTALDQPVPFEAQGAEAVYQEFLENVLPYRSGNLHPRFWGWVQGTGTPLAMLADMLAAGMNAHLAGFNQAPSMVEHQVIAWLAELLGMPKSSSGILLSGGSMACIIGVAVARHAKAGFDVRELGLQNKATPRLIFYGSTEVHGWAQKGVELLGVGNESLRRIPVDKDFRIDVQKLREAIAEDRSRGHRPVCVIGTAGTVNTGAVDDLQALAEVCAEEDLWFHVDGAFGALARLAPALRERVEGLELADSLAFDLHKWMYLPFEVACVLVRDAEAHREAFALTPSYLTPSARGVIAGGLSFADRGVELTRSFKALKVWMALKAEGVNTFAKLIEQNVRQCEYLAAMIEAHPRLELLAPVSLNIVCFRYAAEGFSEEQLNALNQEVLLRLQESGVSVPSSTMINGKFAIRVANVNHRSRREDFEMLVSAVLRLGEEVERTMTRTDRER